MYNVLLVGVGGAMGCALRHSVHLYITSYYGNLVANIIGCFLAGILASMFIPNSPAKFFILTGFLGGLTTFSGVFLEATSDFGNNGLKWAAIYVLITNILCIAAFSIAAYLSNLFRHIQP